LNAKQIAANYYYSSGEPILLADQVLDGYSDGVVVCMIAPGGYSATYTEAEWGYLKKGVLIHFPQCGLVYYEDPQEEQGLKLVRRAKKQQA
jgi:hypothetical protein